MSPKLPKSPTTPEPQASESVEARADDVRSLLDAVQRNWAAVSLTAEQMRAVRRLAASVGHRLGDGESTENA